MIDKSKFKANTFWTHPDFDGHYRIIEVREKDVVLEAYYKNYPTQTKLLKWTWCLPMWTKLEEYVPLKQGVCYVNIYPNNSIAHNTKKKADERAGFRLACIEVPWVEGEGL